VIESDAISDTSTWISNAADCVWANYHDSYVVFHRPSGKTHFLNAAGYRLLTEILDRPGGTASVAAELTVAGAEEPSRLNVDEVHAMLVRFEYLGLVDRSVPQS
jgi:PqqD family protein of HPr-rel-A system